MKEIRVELPTQEQLETELKRLRFRREYRKILWNTMASLLVAAAVVVLVSAVFLPALRVTGNSMAPTLESDELVVCHKRSSFETGDVIAFYYNNKLLLKRVIGTAGDVIDIDASGTVYVNGEALEEPYLNEKSFGECDLVLPYQVPDDRVFVMGDHRSTSVDSRSTAVGCVAEEAIVGKIVFRLWPLGRLEFFS